MNKYQPPLAFIGALAIVVLVYGAIPFYSIPNLGQVVWTSGFAESFVSAGWPSIRAVNFGLPEESPIAFGLAGAFLQSTYIALFDLHASDAYALMAVTWLALSLFGAVKFCQFLGASFTAASLLSLSYLTLPIVWWHAGYSMVSLGFAMLPLYLYVAFNIIYCTPKLAGGSCKWLAKGAAFFLASLIAVFMDGYTFVMFYAATGLCWCVAFFTERGAREMLSRWVLPIIIVSGFVSYFAYTRYIGITEFQRSPLGNIRAMGIDVLMLVLPSQGVSWLWDVLGVSVPRIRRELFGDESVWMTTFALPLIVVGAAGYHLSKAGRYALPLLIISLFSLYLSLGPALKFDAARPIGSDGEQIIKGDLMPKKVALAPTGSEFMYKYVPGIKNMRTPYRWGGLMFAGLFGLMVLLYLKLSLFGYRWLAWLVVGFVIFSNLPNLYDRIAASRHYWLAMRQMDIDFSLLAEYVGSGSRVFFAPYGNDFIVNYIASTGRYYAYNIGGDKNLYLARRNWPTSLRNLGIQESGDCFIDNVKNVLHSRRVDKLILPYFDMLWGAHEWPRPTSELVKYRKTLSPVVLSFVNDPAYVVRKADLFAIISNSPNVRQNARGSGDGLKYGEVVRLIKAECKSASILDNGWNDTQAWGTWSSEEASLRVPLADECLHNESCGVAISFNVFNASLLAPKRILVEINGQKAAEWMVDSSAMQKRIIPLGGNFSKTRASEAHLIIKVPDATSPSDLGMSEDERVFGIGLHALELVRDASVGNISHIGCALDFNDIIHINKVSCEKGSLFQSGWHGYEPWGVWSSASSTLSVVVPKSCLATNECALRLSFNVFNASQSTPKAVQVTVGGTIVANWAINAGGVQERIVPFPADLLKETGEVELQILVPAANSPKKLGQSGDARVLGLGLRKLELVHTQPTR